jgi:hypothetical protein
MSNLAYNKNNIQSLILMYIKYYFINFYIVLVMLVHLIISFLKRFCFNNLFQIKHENNIERHNYITTVFNWNKILIKYNTHP